MMASDPVAPAHGTEFVSKYDGAAVHSRFVQRIRRRYERESHHLPPGAPTATMMAAVLQQLREQGLDLRGALRVLRHLVLERLAVLDCAQDAPLSVPRCGSSAWASLAPASSTSPATLT